MKSYKPKVVITYATRWTYFHWFLLGLYNLEKMGKINLKFKLPFTSYLRSNRYTNSIGEKLKLFKADSYNLYGYVEYENHIIKRFCIDSADAPYLFNSKDLSEVNCYFKMQCPKEINKKGFQLTNEVTIPWQDHLHEEETGIYFVAKAKGKRKLCTNFSENCYKIKPLMIGPRRLGEGIRYCELKKGYDNYLKDRKMQKCKKVMCYYGNTKGPLPSKNIKFPDLDAESDIMGFYKNLSHPNEKRAKVADIINSLGEEYDARIICNGNSDSNQEKNKNLIIPLKKFCAHVSNFQYNFNVSGYKLSIPNRFIESFIVGTGIITDKLYIKWYLPFDKEEVIETEKMGYLEDKEIDWTKVKHDLINLPKLNSKKIVECFEEKWAPSKVAEYILKEIKKS